MKARKNIMPQAGRLTRRAFLAGGGAMLPAPAVLGQADPYYLQLGEYLDASHAADAEARLRQSGFNAYTVPHGASTLVLLGPYADRAAAASAAAELRASTGLNGMIVHSPRP